MRLAIIIEYFALWAGFGVFTFGYAWSTGGVRRGGWRRTEAGRLIMALSASCFWVLSLGIGRLIWPQYTLARDVVLVGSYGALVWVVWWLNSLLLRVQRQRRRERSGS